MDFRLTWFFLSPLSLHNPSIFQLLFCVCVCFQVFNVGPVNSLSLSLMKKIAAGFEQQNSKRRLSREKREFTSFFFLLACLCSEGMRGMREGAWASPITTDSVGFAVFAASQTSSSLKKSSRWRRRRGKNTHQQPSQLNNRPVHPPMEAGGREVKIRQKRENTPSKTTIPIKRTDGKQQQQGSGFFFAGFLSFFPYFCELPSLYAVFRFSILDSRAHGNKLSLSVNMIKIEQQRLE